MHRNVGGINVLQVSLCIILEIVGDTEPTGKHGSGYLVKETTRWGRFNEVQ